jgi:hypothetical protein
MATRDRSVATDQKLRAAVKLVTKMFGIVRANSEDPIEISNLCAFSQMHEVNWFDDGEMSNRAARLHYQTIATH